MHIILLKFGKNRERARDHMADHNAWIDKGVSDGIFQCIGSLDVGGGFILAHGNADDEIRERVADDPFVEHEIVTAEIHRVNVNRTVPQLDYLASSK